MTNLDSIFKSKHITLPAKVYIVKAVVISVVMYGCENWTIQKNCTKRVMAFSTIISWQIDAEKLETVADFIF